MVTKRKTFGKKILLWISLCLMGTGIYAQARLSEKAFASILTCGPGKDFYTSFGHTALRICDTTQNIDYVFNYGTFDFNTPHFYTKFSMGRLQYMLSLSYFSGFMEEYAMEGRSVSEQKLHLQAEELQRLWIALSWNLLPENRYYAYDLLLDNCATRVRDQLESALAGRCAFSKAYGMEGLTYRQLLHPAMDGQLEWWKFGIDLVLGMRCDRPVRTFDHLFLPLALQQQTDTLHADGQLLAEPSRLLLPATMEPLSPSLNPAYVFWLLLGLFVGLSLYEHRKRRQTLTGKIADTCLYAATSLLGLLIAFLWFCSSHYCTQWNINLLWANPLFVLLLFSGKKSRKRTAVLLWACCLSSVIIYCLQWPQSLPPAALPILLILLLRIGRRLSQENKATN